MKHRMTISLLAAISCLLLLAGTILSGVPRLVSYQGRATNASGNPVADGAHDAWFFLYTSSSGATYVWSDHAAIQTNGGLFNYTLGSDPAAPLPDSIFTKYDSLFLGIVLDGEQLAPLTPLTTSPYAFRVNSLDSAKGGAVRGNLKLVDQYVFAAIERSNFGGQLYVKRDATHYGMLVYGDIDGTSSPYLLLNGTANQALFDMRAAGNGSVQLPNSAINSLEMANEPGVGSYINQTGYEVAPPTGQFTYLGSRAMFAPSDGFVLVTASAEIKIQHTLSVVDEYAFGISDNCTSLYASSKISVRLPGNFAAGQFSYPVSVHGLFPIDSGTTTFCFMAERLSGSSCSVENITITELFVPTAYTTVIQPSAAIAPGDPESERGLELTFHEARLQAEMEKMKEEVEAMKEALRKVQETSRQK